MPAPDMLAALREGRLLNDAKLQALRVFAAQMTRERSWLSHAELQAFYDAVLARYGGRRIARGGKVVILEGPAETRRVVIAEFADFDSAERCYRSPEYQAIIAYRMGCATFEFSWMASPIERPMLARALRSARSIGTSADGRQVGAAGIAPMSLSGPCGYPSDR